MPVGLIRSNARRSYAAFTYLTLFGLAIAMPLLLLLGALLFQSASVEREQLQARVLQIVSALTDESRPRLRSSSDDLTNAGNIASAERGKLAGLL
jgi:hypothetical protein